MGIGVRKASVTFREGSRSSTKGSVFDTVRSPKGDTFSVMDRHAFDSAAGRADKVLEKLVSGYGGRDGGNPKRK